MNDKSVERPIILSTIKDIAAEAGVSVMTVSNVINELSETKPIGAVQPEKKKKEA